MKGKAWKFWNEYKRAFRLLENYCHLRPTLCKQLTLLEGEECDTIIFPPIADVTLGARLTTTCTANEYKIFRAELTKIENYVLSITDGRYKEKSKNSKSRNNKSTES